MINVDVITGTGEVVSSFEVFNAVEIIPDICDTLDIEGTLYQVVGRRWLATILSSGDCLQLGRSITLEVMEESHRQ